MAITILMLAPSPEAKGPVGRHTSVLIRELAKHDVHVIRRPWGAERQEISHIRRVAGRLGQLIEAARMVVTVRPDAIVVKTAHDWNTLLRDLALLLVALASKTPLIIQFHGSQPEVLAEKGPRTGLAVASRMLVRFAAGVLVLSSQESELWNKFASPRTTCVVKNPYSLSGTVPNRSESGDGTLRVLFVGRLVREKGILETVDACGLMPYGTCRLVIAGEGPLERTVGERCAALGVHADLLGYVPPARLAEVYGDSDVLVLPTSWREGMPMVILEAMDAGLSIVTTAHRGMLDVLVDGKNAEFVRPEASEISEALRRLRSTEYREAMRAANKDAIQAYRPDRVAAEYADAIRSVLAGSKGRWRSEHLLSGGGANSGGV